MSHNLTQPEEIDLIWTAMANHDVEVEMPVQEWALLSGTIRNAERHEAERHELVKRTFSVH